MALRRKPHVARRSPKGLIGINSRDLIVETAELGSNKALIASLREFATTTIRDGGRDPNEYNTILATEMTADRGYLAARVLDRLDGITASLAIIERNRDVEIVRMMAAQVARDALALAFEFQALAIVKYESPIVTGAAVLEGLDRRRAIVNSGLHAERSRAWKRWNAEARKIWERHPTWSLQAVATQVKKDLGVTDAVRTIARRLTKPGTAS